MKLEAIIFALSAVLGVGLSAEPSVNCPVPVSPPNGIVQPSTDGNTVMYTCDPGFELRGTKFAHCDGTRWKPDPPTCRLKNQAVPVPSVNTADVKVTTPRPLFKWDDDGKEIEVNDTETDMQGDEARVQMVLLPHRRVVTRFQRIRSGSELEQEDQTRQNKSETDNADPSNVRRSQREYKSKSQEEALLRNYRRASLHLARDPHRDVQLFHAPNDVHSDEALRRLYWASYVDPRYASMFVHSTAAGHPLVMTLSESQMAWINSLHPEVRDKYLKDLYGIRAKELDEGVRAQAFLRRYEDAANYYYNPYYYRQALSVLVDNPVASFDYSCYQTEDDGHVALVRAPSLPNAYIHRYDRRQNPNHPYNDYLAAEYRCRTGYTLVDYRVNELYCSQKGWVGTLPNCVPRH